VKLLHAPGLRALLRKELSQVRRSRSAIVSSTLLPFFLMVVSPTGQFLALSTLPPSASNLPPGLAGVPGLADSSDPTEVFTHFLMPLFIALSGLLIPSVMATYTVVAERERRTIELLLALPVGVGDILGAKLIAMLTMGVLVVLPFFCFDAVALLALHLATPDYVMLLLVMLAAALCCSTGMALLLGLLARDHRTANNLNGALLAPLMALIVIILGAVPGDEVCSCSRRPS
jgi:ABC-type Na+ efflux pump permease subunit